MNWKNRSLSFVWLGLAIGSHLYATGAAPWVWACLVLQFGLYPQLLYLHGRYAAHPSRAEVQNMLIDAACFAIWAAALGFPLWISFILFIGAGINLLAFRGWLGGLEVLAVMAAAVVLVGLIQPLHFSPDTTVLTTVLCMCTLSSFLAVFAQDSFQRASLLHRQRNLLQGQLVEIQALKDRLAEQAERDALTGLLNRRMLEWHLPRLLAGCRGRHSSLVLMLLDIDHFKQTNDTYGHAAGDQLLQSLARHLLQYCRSQDMVFRYGGDEFLVLFPDTSLEVAHARAKALCEAFSQSPRRLERLSLPVSLSCGLSAFPLHADQATTLIEGADKALYQAKAQGRNCVVVYAPAFDVAVPSSA
ncbi:diguanylate cyclase domain-containing protein [Comamonas sp. GB3 AK4-5]|uniref:sensor domain-containing diguanylate cyclase n=1 Tax=Comamonas sp. GB3 AK4-5 TaxID=3231487 RepID=UPI00351ED3C7